VVIDVWAHFTVQPLPTRKSSVQLNPSSQLVGQLPAFGGGIPTSHDSPIPTTPSPQLCGQSVSVA